MFTDLHSPVHTWPRVAGQRSVSIIGSLPNNDPSAILYCPALTAAIDDEMSGAPLPKARKVTACTTVTLRDSCTVCLCFKTLCESVCAHLQRGVEADRAPGTAESG